MRILTVHTRYQIEGGEDAVFKQECELLREDDDVATLMFKNAGGLQGAVSFLFSIWNIAAGKKMRKEITKFKPDVIHIHNWHFAPGPVIIRVAKSMNIPVVITLHNYRLLCPSATLIHNKQLFTDSLKQDFPWKAIFLKVYRKSFFQTFWLAFIIWFHKKVGTWRMVDRYIVLTKFAKELIYDSSLDLSYDKIVVKPNFVEPAMVLPKTRSERFLFIGRLSEEKGINVLLKAFMNSDFELEIAGTGPLIDEVRLASKKHRNIKFLGTLNRDQVRERMIDCSALIFPSIWFEGMPMTLLEAFSLRTPVIASNLGAMATMIENEVNGLHFEAGNVSSLAQVVKRWASTTSAERESYSEGAYAFFQKMYTPEINKQLLKDVYEGVI